MALRCNGLEDGRLVGQEREWENFPEQTGDGVLAFLDPTMECLCLSTCLTSFLSLLISPSLLRSSWSLHCYKGKDRKPKFPSLELTLWCWTTLNRMCLPRQDLKSRGWKYDLVKGLPEAWEPELRSPGPSKAKCGSMTVIFFFSFFFHDCNLNALIARWGEGRAESLQAHRPSSMANAGVNKKKTSSKSKADYASVPTEHHIHMETHTHEIKNN